MYHPSRKGIYCDLCGKEVLIEDQEITYYSINMKRVVSRDSMPNDVEDVMDLDFCGDCHAKMHERVLKVAEINNQKRAKYGKSIRPN